MFDLEQSIKDWRRRMAEGGVKSSPVLDELECHLREEIRCRVKAGAAEEQAFREALARMGSADVLRGEFKKLDSGGRILTWSFLLWLGIGVIVAVLRVPRFLDGRAGLLLTVHGLLITTGYLAAFIAGGLAAAYVCAQWFGGASAALKRQLALGATRFLGLATALVIVGFVLALFWTDHHYGRYWTKSIREIGGLTALTGLVTLLVVRRMGRWAEETQALFGLGASLVVGFAWFGMLLIGRRAPLGSWWPMEVFAGFHFFLFALSLARRQKSVVS